MRSDARRQHHNKGYILLESVEALSFIGFNDRAADQIMYRYNSRRPKRRFDLYCESAEDSKLDQYHPLLLFTTCSYPLNLVSKMLPLSTVHRWLFIFSTTSIGNEVPLWSLLAM